MYVDKLISCNFIKEKNEKLYFCCYYDDRKCHKRYKSYKKSNKAITNTDDLNHVKAY